MTVRIERVMSGEEFTAMGDDAVARGFYRNDRRLFLPGTAWFMPWFYDPTGERVRQGKHVLHAAPPADPNARTSHLSPHYWRDHAAHRPPICVICPNGDPWEIDAWSSNGTGWTVTGELPRITCAPSIVAGDYHGFLRDGEFTPDLEGRTYG